MNHFERRVKRLRENYYKKIKTKQAKGSDDSKDNILDQSIEDLAAEIAGIDDQNKLEELLVQENTKEKPRKGAIEAIEDRIEALKEAEK